MHIFVPATVHIYHTLDQLLNQARAAGRRAPGFLKLLWCGR